ncbi:MAG: polysaccharide deacetylase family protein [Sedimentisphaerales bacterium]|nr:polysaccharide deacetylase family protein [Sedimentisphaerales bacterium]
MRQVLSRRNFIKSGVLCGIGAGVISCQSNFRNTRQAETRYIAAYDTESPDCLAACRKIAEVHRRFEMPATFFILGRTLDANPKEYRRLLDDPLFEIASHTYSHRMLRHHPFCGSAIPLEEKRKEIFEGKASVERVFERPCLGLRPGCGFDNALKGEPEVLEILRQAGIRYTSSLLWGPDYSLPALLREPFPYKEEGFPELWELPGHGWHENLLKDHNQWGPRRLTLWPSPFPEAIAGGFCKTPKDEFNINRIFLDRAAESGACFVSLIWHPWSLYKFDPDMKMLELTFTYVRRLGHQPCTYAQLYESVGSA